MQRVIRPSLRGLDYIYPNLMITYIVFPMELIFWIYGLHLYGDNHYSW